MALSAVTLTTVVIAFESEEAARRRLEASGDGRDVAAEIAVYLAQSTDLPHFAKEIVEAMTSHGLKAEFVALDDLPSRLCALAPERDRTIVWAMTDGVRFYRGSAARRPRRTSPRTSSRASRLRRPRGSQFRRRGSCRATRKSRRSAGGR